MRSHTEASGPGVLLRAHAHARTRLHAPRTTQVLSSPNEAGLSKADQAKQLLTKYGSAYLITSISFAAVSFGTCFALVNSGAACVGLPSWAAGHARLQRLARAAQAWAPHGCMRTKPRTRTHDTHAGVDVASLLSKLGLEVNQTSEKVGTFALAYAAHKALSPVRFPPTVALTPVVAKWLGKDKEEGKQ